MKAIGVLALQGAFEAHLKVLAKLGLPGLELRRRDQLAEVGGLILPGGESTAQLRLLEWEGLREPLVARVAAGLPVLATCAGLILLARRVENPEQPALGLLDVAVRRNGYGRQLDSFEGLSDGGRSLVFIRAPKIVQLGAEVEVLDSLGGEPVCVRQGAIIGACFHPELGPERELYRELFCTKAPRRAKLIAV